VTLLAQLEELARASRYPKFKAVLQPHRVGAMVNNLQRALVLDRLPNDTQADDPFDAFLLEMALAGEADYLVTDDYRAGLLQRSQVGRTRILTPAAFCLEVL
jgi:predicted nucleic acid-binding protein